MKTTLFSAFALFCVVTITIQGIQMQKMSKENILITHDLIQYRVDNNRNVPRKNISKEYELISQYTNPCIPIELIMAIRVHENGSMGREFGAKRFYELGEHGQYKTANKIIEQEVKKFIEENRKEFVNQLSERWNHADRKNWSKSVLKIWEDENERD